MRSRSIVVLLLLLLALPACRARAVPEPVEGPPTRLHVLVINGGGAKAMNYQSHFLHVRHLLDLLGRVGVPPERVTVFSSDGADPAADMAVREVEPGGDFWLLRGTRLEGALGPQIVYANSELAGVTLQAATKAGLKAWFRTARKKLRAGDTLLLYVTDHGSKNAEDTSNNRITLWGDKEAISVEELRALLEQLDPNVRVVALMSQCFSGAFANLRSVHAKKGAAPHGSTCGYFSSTADRMAYGCYPENRGKDNVGHAFHFLQALETTRSLAQSHAEVLVTDHTPDVPIRTSDAYLDELLDHAAKAANQERTAFVDALLREAWRDKAAWEPDIRLLDRTAHAFGLFSPRSLEELEQQTKRLPDVSEQLSNHGKAWRMTVGDLAEANLGRFLAAQADWGKRVDSTAMAALDAAGRQALAAALLKDLDAYTGADTTTAGRFRTLRERAETASAAAYRMEVRLAAVLRLRALLASIAGRVWLATHAAPGERTAYEKLRACEDLRLGAPPASPTTVVSTPEPFPPYDDDVKLAENVLPAWMGINFRQAAEKSRTEHQLKEGAAAVLTVYPDSPANAAGLEVGDLIVGPPGHPFVEPHQVREWTMLSPIDKPAPLVVQRGDRQLEVTLVPKPYPVRLPELPGPPKIGSAAPSVPLNQYRGAVPTALADGKPHLLFFWATWCAPCKASIPELLAFEGARSTQVIAITDEPSEQLDAFFKHYEGPFPATVATDELRRAFQAYAVSGTPSFVLVDGAGNVAAQATGYTPEKGLGIEGWKWTKDAASPGGAKDAASPGG